LVKTLKDDVKGNDSAEVQIDPTGRFLYASNRLTTNYLTIFSIDHQTGRLTAVGDPIKTVHGPICVKFVGVENR
jgi:6-phosphogluconolactonase (cycloisomerase 2 family)